MYLLLSIILCSFLGYILLLMGPLVGGIVAFGIIVGCIFRGLFLLNEINKKISINLTNPKEDISNLSSETYKVPEHFNSPRAYKKYLEEKNN
ncbi:hypothetical protein [Peribacillus alkalitolerans]|uniref:hypothetical protein n=1 Tax=Peribacillus alkalitolerans TaxID=1550385 RepID=UPI0013D80156|nr:hypothetical protein [Peribacillus alkalitolerans]